MFVYDWKAGDAAGQQGHSDVEKLQKLTDSNMNLLAPKATLSVAGGVHLPRLVSKELANTKIEGGNVLIVGDAGVGKTGVAVTLAQQRQSSHDVVLLQASDIVSGYVDAKLGQPLEQALTAWVGPAPATLIIDGLDAARGSGNQTRLIQQVQALAGTRWQAVATIRIFDVLHSPEVNRAFVGQPVSTAPELVDPRLDWVRHLLVGDLTDAELKPALCASPVLAEFFDTATVEMARLLHNPFNLGLAVELLTGTVPLTAAEEGRLYGARSRLNLLDTYWDHRVNNEDMTTRSHLLTCICQRMLADRDLTVIERAPTVTGTDSAAVEGLLSQNVLALDPQAITGGARVLVFAHNILFDYAAARYVLLDPQDPSALITRLDEDPALPLVARPSLDLVIERLWGQERGRFWTLALQLAGSSHLLASLAVAGHLLRSAPDSADLHPLLDALTGSDPDPRTAAEALASQVVGALRAPVTPEGFASAAVPGIGWLAAQLARSAVASNRFAEAALSVDLLTSLERRQPLRSAEPGAADRAATVAALLDACRADPQRFEAIAGAAGRHLPGATAAEPTVAHAVIRLLDDEAAMNQWGGTILHRLAAAVPALLDVDPVLARRTVFAIWTFDEQRDEQVSFGGGPLLVLNESRRQQAQHGEYELGRLFPDLCVGGLVVSAAQIFADIADTGLHTPSSPDNNSGWPVIFGETQGWLQDGRPLDILGHGTAAHEMARALRDAMASRGAEGGEPGPVLTHLTSCLHSAGAWAALLEPGDDPEGLVRALLPALTSGSLLTHPLTHESAGHLLSSLSGTTSTDLAGALEQAVVAAGDRATTNGLPDRFLDELLGCLDPAAVTSPVLTSRLDELEAAGGAPSLTPRISIGFEGRYTLLDRLAEDGVHLPDGVALAVSALDEELAFVRNGKADERPEQERRLPELFLAADTAIHEVGLDHEPLHMLLVQAACTLAGDDRLLPGTPAGQRAAVLLLEAADSDGAGRFLE